MYESLRDSLETALDAWRRLSAGARHAIVLAAAAVPGYFLVAAIISSSTAPSPAPPPSDVPHTGMLLGNGKLLPEERFTDFKTPPETREIKPVTRCFT